MRHHLSVKGPLTPDEVRKWLVRPLARLRRRLRRFPGDAVHLHTLVREADGKPHARVSLTLQLPSNTLRADEEGADARSALQEAFGELERSLDKEKARLRRTEAWRPSRDAFHRELLERAGREGREVLSRLESEQLLEQLAAVEQFVRRELHWLEASREIAFGEVDARDVVDSAFLRAASRHDGRPPRAALLQAASAALRAELARARAAREEVRIEDDVPEVPPQRAVSTLGGEIYDFYQPDEDLRLGDLIGGLSDTPEQIEASAELLDGLRAGLAALPASWRQAFHLSQVEGLDESEVARALELPREAVAPRLARARDFLRERLREAGLLDAGPARRAP